MKFLGNEGPVILANLPTLLVSPSALFLTAARKPTLVSDTPPPLTELPEVKPLRRVWQRHYRCDSTDDEEAPPRPSQVRFATQAEVAQDSAGIESPYDQEARYRNKDGLEWIGYAVHLRETGEADAIHLITRVKTTPAKVAEVKGTEAIPQALVDRGRAPGFHLTDAGYIAADLLVSSQTQRGIRLIGPVRKSARWQDKAEGAYGWEPFHLDWAAKSADCPPGPRSVSGYPFQHPNGHAYIRVEFARQDGSACSERSRCPRAKVQPRSLQLQPQPQPQTIQQTRVYLKTEEGRELYQKRAGIEGTLSQSIRGFGLRHSRSIGLAKTHLQQVASAAALNLERLAA